MLRSYLKNLHISFAYLLSFSSLMALGVESAFAMQEEKNMEFLPTMIIKKDQNWEGAAQDHNKTACRFEQMIKDMNVKDIPPIQKDDFTYVQLITKHREFAMLCDEISELKKKGSDISVKKTEAEQKLIELYGPFQIQFQSDRVIQKVQKLLKTSDKLTICLGCGGSPQKENCPDPHDNVVTIDRDLKKKPDLVVNFFSPSFVSVVQETLLKAKIGKIVLEALPPEIILDETFLKTLKNLSSKGTELIFNDFCYFTSLDKEYFSNQELCMYERHGPFHAVAMNDEEEINEETKIEQLDLSSSKPSEENSVFIPIEKEHIIMTLMNRYKFMRDLFEPFGFYIKPFYFPTINAKKLDYNDDRFLPKSPNPKENASPYLWTGVFNPMQKLIEIGNNNIFNLVPLEQLIPTLLTPFEKVESTPIENKKPKPCKKKVNKKITTIKIEKTDLNTKSVDKILQFIEGDDKKKGNNNRSIKTRKKKKTNNNDMQKKEEKKNEKK